MPKSSLDPDGQKRLERALELADGKLENVKNAVREAIKGVAEGRAIYLRNRLTQLARGRIRYKDKSPDRIVAAMLLERRIADARAHAEQTRAGWDDDHKP